MVDFLPCKLFEIIPVFFVAKGSVELGSCPVALISVTGVTVFAGGDALGILEAAGQSHVLQRSISFLGNLLQFLGICLVILLIETDSHSAYCGKVSSSGNGHGT